MLTRMTAASRFRWVAAVDRPDDLADLGDGERAGQPLGGGAVGAARPEADCRTSSSRPSWRVRCWRCTWRMAVQAMLSVVTAVPSAARSTQLVANAADLLAEGGSRGWWTSVPRPATCVRTRCGASACAASSQRETQVDSGEISTSGRQIGG